MADKSNDDTAQTAAEKEAADKAAAEKAAAEKAASAKKSLEKAIAELGIKPDKDGKVSLELLTSLAGVNVKARGEEHVCGPAEAVRMIRAGFAKLRG